MEGYHKSVLLKEVIEALKVKKGRWYLDSTLGDGGYGLEILKLGGNVIGIDVDPEALKRTKKRFENLEFGDDRFRLIQGNFRDINSLILQTETERSKFGAKHMAGAIFDLGVSSLQLESPERGFSFGKEGPLDMRMDPSLGIQALDLVNNLSRKELYGLFNKLGEEKYSWRLAGSLELARKVKPFTTTIELAEVVEKALGGVREKIHPATRVFQALRIAVNDELGALEEGLESVKDLIENDGRIIIISFHSLEDRIVKVSFRDWEERGLGKVLTKKPIVPTEEEVRNNFRSRSAKMRVFEI